MNSSEWALAVAVIAVAIAKNRTEEEIEFLSVIFLQLGGTLATIAISPPHGGGDEEDEERGEGAIL